MAHFLEHLVFKGGEKYDDYRKVNETAERMGGSLNAYTSHDLVAFHITVRAEAAMEAHRPADRLRRPPEDRRRRARPRARRRHPGDPALQGPAVGGGRGAHRPRRVRRPPARAHRPRARGAPAHVQPRGDRRLPRAALGRRARRRLRRRQPRPRARPTARSPSCSSASPRCPTPTATTPAPHDIEPQMLVEQRDTNQSHLRMIYRPRSTRAIARAARRADDLLDAAGRLDGLAPVRRDPRAARPLLLASAPSTTRSPTRRCSQLGAGPRVGQVRRGLHAHARDRRRAAATDGPTEEEVERARAYAAGRRVLAFENTNAVARYAATQTIVSARPSTPTRRSPRSTR